MGELINSLKLMRFPFSVFLLPVSLFSFYFIKPAAGMELLLVLLVWHLLVYPSSNGYNSYHDQDTGPIGALAHPPKASTTLLFLCNLMDAAAIGIALYIQPVFAIFVVLYVIASRLYSHRDIRLKKFPLISFLVVFFFQGIWIFMANVYAFSTEYLFIDSRVMISAIASSFLIGTIYPISQIYQHEADEKDGIKTLSMLLGKKGTFLFSGAMFIFSTVLIYFSVGATGNNDFLLYNIVMLPASLYFIYWASRSFKNESEVNFRNTMIMLGLSSLLINIYFLILLLR